MSSADEEKPFHVLKTSGLRLFTLCEELEGQWRAGGEDGMLYPVKEDETAYLPEVYLPLIVGPDNQQWMEGNLYLLGRAREYPPLSETTLDAEASNLAHLRNTMFRLGVDYRNFSGRKFERPTYLYQAEFKPLIMRGEMTPESANNKIRTAVRFYSEQIAKGSIRPKGEPWKSRTIRVSYTDKVGVLRSKEVSTTDLIFSTSSKEEDGTFINDGGRLFPLTAEQQISLHAALDETGNTEMQLAFHIALLSGARQQSVFTLREADILDAGEFDNKLYPTRIGYGTFVDSKNNKKQVIKLPGWMHYRLRVYVSSKRYQKRKSKAIQKAEGEQYLFLSRGGRPYYVANADKRLYQAREKGSAVRSFIKKSLLPLVSKSDCQFEFSFHDLRATFGMNLIEERMSLLNKGEISPFELLDYVRGRLCHESIITTMRYLDFRRLNELTYVADVQYQEHILSFAVH